jgi:hypothetical protein
MKLKERIRIMTDHANERIELNPYSAPPHRTETVDELFTMVINACEDRANEGCGTLDFDWKLVYSTNRIEWDRQKAIREQVVDKLTSEGFVAEGYPENFVDIDYNPEHLDNTQFAVPHGIYVSW